jgi:hypothetical protein
VKWGRNLVGGGRSVARDAAIRLLEECEPSVRAIEEGTSRIQAAFDAELDPIRRIPIIEGARDWIMAHDEVKRRELHTLAASLLDKIGVHRRIEEWRLRTRKNKRTSDEQKAISDRLAHAHTILADFLEIYPKMEAWIRDELPKLLPLSAEFGSGRINT